MEIKNTMSINDRVNLPDRELKYIFDENVKESLLTELKFKCADDSEYEYNTINSIYFDTVDHLLAMEKASSDYFKSKVRIRWYTYPNNETKSKLYLEFKRKIGSTREKKRILLPYNYNECQLLLADGILPEYIRKQISLFCPELVSLNLKPMMVISYNRHRFVEPFTNSRVACDSEIRARSFSVNSGYVHTSIRLNNIVLEIKGKGDVLPTCLRSLSVKGLKKAAFSKYYECFCRLADYDQ